VDNRVADLQILMSKLNEIKVCTKNLQHIKVLMSKTKELRRDWIINKETDARCSVIMRQFPYLKTSELVRKNLGM